MLRLNPGIEIPNPDEIIKILDTMGCANLNDRHHDEVVAHVTDFLDYMEAALRAAPESVRGDVYCEYTFAMPGHNYNEWHLTLVWCDDDSVAEALATPHYLPPDGQIITSDEIDEDGVAAHTERAQWGKVYVDSRQVDYWNEDTYHRVDEPAAISHNDVMNHGGGLFGAALEMQGSGLWTHPVTAKGTLPTRREPRGTYRAGPKKGQKIPPKYKGVWYFIGRDHPQWETSEDRDWWLPRQWKRVKTTGPGRRRRVRAFTSDAEVLGPTNVDDLQENPHDFSDRDLDAALGEDFGETGEHIARLFEDLIATAPVGTFDGPLRLVVDEETALAGRPRSSRAHACCGLDLVGLDEGTNSCTVFIAPKLIEPEKPLPGNRGDRTQALALAHRQRGILMHELAHASLLQHGNDTHTEREADALAEKLWGHTIFYDEDGVQTTGHGVSPRPREYDRKKNPGTPTHRRIHKDC